MIDLQVSDHASLFIGSSEYRSIRLSARLLSNFLVTGQLLFHDIINLGARAISSLFRLIIANFFGKEALAQP